MLRTTALIAPKSGASVFNELIAPNVGADLLFSSAHQMAF